MLYLFITKNIKKSKQKENTARFKPGRFVHLNDLLLKQTQHHFFSPTNTCSKLHISPIWNRSSVERPITMKHFTLSRFNCASCFWPPDVTKEACAAEKLLQYKPQKASFDHRCSILSTQQTLYFGLIEKTSKYNKHQISVMMLLKVTWMGETSSSWQAPSE